MPDDGGRGTDGWAIRAYHLCDGIVWIAKLNLLWLAFTALGGVVLGAAPATVAAHTLARRRLRGQEGAVVAAFASVWRSQFVAANALLLPVALLAGLLAINWLIFGAAPGAGAAIVAGLVLVASALLAAIAALLVPLYVHYDLPLRSYPVMASRFLLANPAAGLLLLVSAVGIAAVTTFVPALALFFTIGAWIHLDTALCLSFFAANDERVTAADPVSA
jgi:uncharacterized membrane protein YesL